MARILNKLDSSVVENLGAAIDLIEQREAAQELGESHLADAWRYREPEQDTWDDTTEIKPVELPPSIRIVGDAERQLDGTYLCSAFINGWLKNVKVEIL